jgi:hypothetical protein
LAIKNIPYFRATKLVWVKNGGVGLELKNITPILGLPKN